MRIFEFTRRLLKSPRMIVPVAVVMGFCFLLLDALVDTAYFDEERRGFLSNLVNPEPMDFWMRAVVFALIVSFAFYARSLLHGLLVLTNQLTEQRDSLAHRVAEATHELESRNRSLEAEVVARRDLEVELQSLVITDPLTRLFNRRKILQEIAAAQLIDRRYRTGVAIIMCDIDHFKAINDAYGHDVGDAVLLRFSELLKEHMRETDIVARWGGEEFVVLLTVGESDKAVAIAEKLRVSVQGATFPKSISVTASFGVAVLGSDGSVDDLLQHADQAMYQAKAEGRNAVRLFDKTAALAS